MGADKARSLKSSLVNLWTSLLPHYLNHGLLLPTNHQADSNIGQKCLPGPSWSLLDVGCHLGVFRIPASSAPVSDGREILTGNGVIKGYLRKKVHGSF